MSDGPAYEGPRGIPHVTDAQAGLGQTGRPATRNGREGSRGGPPIWLLHSEGFGLMPSPCHCGTAGDGPAVGASMDCPRHGPRRRLNRLMDKGGRFGPREAGGHARDFSSGLEGADPDGFAVFGRFPKGLLRHILKLQLLGDVRRDEVLQVCSGTLTERWTVDLRAEARPRVQADGTALPFRDCTFKAVLIDPPYSDAYSRNLYGVENPRPSWLLEEACRVVVPGGRIGLLHVVIPFAPHKHARARLVRVWPVSTGVGFRIRALTIYERAQPGLGW